MPIVCDSCEGMKPVGDRSRPRCETCQTEFDEYVESGWGLDELVRFRESLSETYQLCIGCYADIAGGHNFKASWGIKANENYYDRFCFDCAKNEWWHKEMNGSRSANRTVGNPYKNVWDRNDEDNAVYLNPTLEVMADRLLADARHHERLAERGGPSGRQHADEAAWRVRVAEKLKTKHNQAGQTETVNWWVVKDETPNRRKDVA